MKFLYDKAYYICDMAYDKQPDRERVFQKIKYYCAYQERCHAEVKEKLYAYGLHKADVELLLSKLIEENYLNEERFAIQFAGGRFRIKQWGKNKIIHALKQKQVSAWCIKKAIKEIDPDDYQKTLVKLTAEKWKSFGGEKNSFSRMAKTTSFLLMRGFEAPLIREALKNTPENE